MDEGDGIGVVVFLGDFVRSERIKQLAQLCPIAASLVRLESILGSADTKEFGLRRCDLFGSFLDCSGLLL